MNERTPPGAARLMDRQAVWIAAVGTPPPTKPLVPYRDLPWWRRLARRIMRRGEWVEVGYTSERGEA